MITQLEKFIFDKFNQLPIFIRSVVYLLFVTTYIYLLVSPNYIDGKLVIKEEGIISEEPFRNIMVSRHIDGRMIKMKTNEEIFKQNSFSCFSAFSYYFLKSGNFQSKLVFVFLCVFMLFF